MSFAELRRTSDKSQFRISQQRITGISPVVEDNPAILVVSDRYGTSEARRIGMTSAQSHLVTGGSDFIATLVTSPVDGSAASNGECDAVTGKSNFAADGAVDQFTTTSPIASMALAVWSGLNNMSHAWGSTSNVCEAHGQGAPGYGGLTSWLTPN